MIKKIKPQDLQWKSKYKATYKCLNRENIITHTISNPANVMTNFLHQNGDIYEMYMLVSIEPLDGAEN